MAAAERPALAVAGLAVAAGLVWLAVAVRQRPATPPASHRPAAAPPAAPAPAGSDRPASSLPAADRARPALPGGDPRQQFLASAEDKWQRFARDLALSPEGAARAWAIIRAYREAVYPHFAATALRHRGDPPPADPAAARVRQRAYLEELYYGPAVEAARRRALAELGELVPGAALAEVEPSLVPAEDIAALERAPLAGE